LVHDAVFYAVFPIHTAFCGHGIYKAHCPNPVCGGGSKICHLCEQRNVNSAYRWPILDDLVLAAALGDNESGSALASTTYRVIGP
jgi:hypothetical protein